MSALLLLLALAFGADEPSGSVHVVRPGETVASVAALLGEPDLVPVLRELNGLAPAEEPVVGALLRLPPTAGASRCEPSFVVSHHGTGTVSLPWTSSPRPLADLEPLPLGATVCTDPGGFARVRVAVSLERRDHDVLTLLPDTCITLRATHRVQGQRTTLLELDRGSVSVEDRGDAGRVIVRTPAGVTLGDAGGFRVAREATSTRTEALAARVATLGGGAEVVLEQGFGSRTEDGEAPGAPQALPVAGAPTAPVGGVPLWAPDFHWTPAGGVLGYMIEVSRDPGGTDLILRERVGAPPWLPERLLLPLADGHWWRVTSFDSMGFEGAPSEPARFALPTSGEAL